MAISFVGSKTFTHNSTSDQSVSLTDLLDESGSAATLLQGDIVVINYSQANTANLTNAAMTPSGYTEFISTDLYQNDTHDANQLVSYKFMGSTPDTTVTIPASTVTGNGVAVTIHAFRGVDATTPSDVTPTTAGGTDTGVADAAAIEPVTAGAWILACGAAAVAAGAAFTNPSGMSTTTNHFRSAFGDGTSRDGVAGTAIYTAWSSGSYNPATFGGSSSTNTGSWTATTIALRPAADSAPSGYVSINAWWLGVGLSSAGVSVNTGSGDAEVVLGSDGVGLSERSGSGDAEIVLGGEGVGLSVRSGSGDAEIVLGAVGVGFAIDAATGSGSAAIELGADGIGSTARSGAGDAEVVVDGVGVGLSVRSGSGDAEIVLGAVGVGFAIDANTGSGVAEIVFGAGGVGSVVRSGSGDGEVVLDISMVAAGIPQEGWVATSLSRVVHASQFNRVVVAFPERR
jgi:hypothetical protein